MITKLQKPSLFYELRNRAYSYRSVGSLKSNKNLLRSDSEFSDEDKIRIVIDGQSNVLPIEALCEMEGITVKTFNNWTNEYLQGASVKAKSSPDQLKRTDEDKFRIVIEGKSGVSSVAKICRRESISQDEFLKWCEDFLLVRNRNSILHKLNDPLYKKNKELVMSESSNEVVSYFENYVDFSSNGFLVVPNPKDKCLENGKMINQILNIQKINDIRFINKYLEKINSKLEMDGKFIGCLETFSARKGKMKINKLPVINNLYFAFEFFVKRILPKVSLTKKYYFDITKGNDRLLSKAEGLGRLVSCGFTIMDYKSIDGLLYFVVKKTRQPYFDESPSYGPLYKMPRLGKNGKMIGVYKFRTMHPYSEYLQDYVINAFGYAETGKPANDFRIPKWGKFMRKFWLDEIPQLLNVLKGDMKLVGVRPVSERYFQDIPREMQKLRMTQLPGCIPPYVALNRDGNVMSVLQAEKDYLVEKIKNPYTTDMKYFFKAIANIIFLNKRSA